MKLMEKYMRNFRRDTEYLKKANKDPRTEKYTLNFKIHLLESADWTMQKRSLRP